MAQLQYVALFQGGHVAWDINFSTCGFEDYLNNAFTGYDYGNTSTGNNSDMGFVRCVED